MSAYIAIATYRLRWQIELAFKRLKSGLRIDALPAHDTQLARSWLAAYLIVGLLIDEAVAERLAFPPASPATPGAHLSLWRMQKFLRNGLLVAILGDPRLARIGQSLAGAARTLFEPPRRRISQFSPLCALPI